MQRKKESELTIITKAKDLCSYIMIVTQKSPKHFRFTFVSRLQNLSLDIIEDLYRANDIFVEKGNKDGYLKRREFQQQAMTNIKILSYFSLLAYEQRCILAKQSTECKKLLGAWMMSDKKRFIS